MNNQNDAILRRIKFYSYFIFAIGFALIFTFVWELITSGATERINLLNLNNLFGIIISVFLIVISFALRKLKKWANYTVIILNLAMFIFALVFLEKEGISGKGLNVDFKNTKDGFAAAGDLFFFGFYSLAFVAPAIYLWLKRNLFS